MDAEPDHRKTFPDPTIWPFVTAFALSVMYVASIFTPWALVYGSIPVALALARWFWPPSGKKPREMEEEVRAGRVTPLEEVL
jgi:cytochrome c oxidase subunit 1